MSGVPQDTVLVSKILIIIISDIDENLKNNISRLFMDDRKLSVKIRTCEDTGLLLLQKTTIIYKNG